MLPNLPGLLLLLPIAVMLGCGGMHRTHNGLEISLYVALGAVGYLAAMEAGRWLKGHTWSMTTWLLAGLIPICCTARRTGSRGWWTRRPASLSRLGCRLRGRSPSGR